MDRKLFSIITPTYNSGLKLEKTVNSILAQGSDLLEYIVVDGGSTDETLPLLETYGDKLKVISERDAGVYDAMNKGIEASSGWYLYFIGAGDSLRENMLGKIARVLPENDLSLVYGNAYMVDQGIVYDGEFSKDKLKRRNICHQAVFYGRTVFDMFGGYDLRFKVLADHAFNIKCFWNDRITKKYVAYVIANYEGGGISRSEVDVDFAYEYAELMKTD